MFCVMICIVGKRCSSAASASMRAVRLRGAHQVAPELVEIPDQFGIVRERLLGRQRGRIVLRPQPGQRVAEGGNARFGADACAGEYGQPLAAADQVGCFLDLSFERHLLRSFRVKYAHLL